MQDLSIQERRARIAEIDHYLFLYAMKDHLTHEDDAEIWKMRQERQDLCDKVQVWVASFEVKHTEKPRRERGYTFKVEDYWIDCITTADPLEVKRLRDDPNAEEVRGYWGTDFVEP